MSASCPYNNVDVLKLLKIKINIIYNINMKK